jgi:hypothetical protein
LASTAPSANSPSSPCACPAASLAGEIDHCCVGAAQENGDLLAGLRAAAAGEQYRKGGRTARLDGDPQYLPEALPRRPNRRLGDQHCALDEALRDREHQPPDPPRRRRVGGDADAVLIPGGDAADQPAAANRYEQLAELQAVGLERSAPTVP